MYNYKLIRLGYMPMFYLMFAGGICMGSIMGLLFGIMDRSYSGILGGAFITFLTGLASGLLGIIYTLVFNTLAPTLGGIPMQITTLPESPTQSHSISSIDESGL